jgi:hypothetical protein
LKKCARIEIEELKKLGEPKLKPLPKEPPNKYKTELRLKVLFKKEQHNTGYKC